MQYRRFGKLDWKVSALGFGAMRLPTTDRDPAHVDEPEAIRMIRYAIDHGVNYLDSAYLYHMGNSERVVGKALKDGYRQRMRLATKIPHRSCETAADFDRILNEQLGKLQTDKIDFYLLHGLNAQGWPKMRDLGIIPWAEKQMAAGKIGHLCFSFHDKYDVLKSIIDAYDNWTFCQVQYNFMDIENQAGRKGVEYAASKGLGVVVMEPIRGGLIAKQPPEVVEKIWATAKRDWSRAEYALQWVWDQPEVSVALSGMSNMQQVVENVASAGRSGPGTLNGDDLKLIDQVRQAYRSLTPIPCTQCGYCQPCPNGVLIPNIFQIYNESTMYNDPAMGKFRYQGPMGPKPEEKADRCMECGECEAACPQNVTVIDWLKKAHETLSAPGQPPR
ncbi:MAG: aldo/keto reductase [Chloroflexi bacterium RBG_16_57_8]|nr:MAG: aldo/keto reductase [Chloroflexi bacterium RBG_16_57_8]